MSFTRTSFILAASIAAGLAAVGSSAALQSKCLAGKNRCMSKEAYSLLKCEQRAEIPGTSIEPALTACRQKARSKFDGATVPSRGCFETLEGKTPNDCFTSDDTDAAAIAVDDCVTRVVDVIDPAPIDQSACNVGKKKCAAKKLKSLLKCHEKAQKPSPKPIEPALSECLQKARAKLDGGADPTTGCIARLEASHGAFAGEILAPAHAALRALVPGELDPESELLGEVIGDLQRAALAVSDAVSLKFFSHAVPRSMLQMASWPDAA